MEPPASYTVFIEYAGIWIEHMINSSLEKALAGWNVGLSLGLQLPSRSRKSSK